MNELEFNIGDEVYLYKQMDLSMINDFVKLFNETKNKSIEPSFFIKKFSNPPADNFYYGYLIYKDKRAVAHCGVIPLWMSYKRKKIKVAQWTDTVTHPDFQKKGLNKFLTEKLLDLCREKSVNFIFRFTNSVSTVIAKEKYNWEQIGYLNQISFEVKSIPIFKVLTKLQQLEIYESYFEKIVKRYEVKETFKQIEDFLSVLRNDTYFEYKKYTKNFKIKIGENLYWIKLEDGLCVGDLVINNKLSVKKDLLFLSKKLGLHQVKIVLSDNHPLWEIVEKFGTLKKLNPIMIKRINQIDGFDRIIFTGADRNIF